MLGSFPFPALSFWTSNFVPGSLTTSLFLRLSPVTNPSWQGCDTRPQRLGGTHLQEVPLRPCSGNDAQGLCLPPPLILHGFRGSQLLPWGFPDFLEPSPPRFLLTLKSSVLLMWLAVKNESIFEPGILHRTSLLSNQSSLPIAKVNFLRRKSYLLYFTFFPQNHAHWLIQEFTGYSAEAHGWAEVTPQKKPLHVRVQTVIITTSEQVAGPDKRAERTFTEDQISPPDLCLTVVHKYSDVLIKTKELIRHGPGTMWLFRDWSIPAFLGDTSSKQFSLHPHPFWSLISWVSSVFTTSNNKAMHLPKAGTLVPAPVSSPDLILRS